MRTTGRTVLITGATSGIGKAMAIELHNRGNTVIACGRRADRLNELHQQYPGIITRVCDVSSAGQRRELALWITTRFPKLDVLINNAGVQYAFNLKERSDLHKMQSEIETNLTAPIHLASLLVSTLSEQPEAAIVNISSGLAFVPLAFMPVYCATKAAIHSFTLSLRYQLKDTGIKVFEIAPPAVDTELGHDRRANKNETHGGIPVEEFISEAFQFLDNDIYEGAVGMAKGLKENREASFDVMNSRIPH